MAETRSRRLKQSRSNASVRDCVVKLQSENEIKRLISQKEDNTHKLNIGIKMHDNKMFVGNKILESDNDTFNLQLKLTSNGISICETAKPNYSVPQVVPIRNLRPRLNSGSVTSCLLSKAESISVVSKIKPNPINKTIDSSWRLCKSSHKQNERVIKINDVVIAKLRGHSPWPSICKEFLSKTRVRVEWLGVCSNEKIGFVNISEITLFKDSLPLVRNILNRGNSKFQKAIQEVEVIMQIPENLSMLSHLDN